MTATKFVKGDRVRGVTTSGELREGTVERGGAKWPIVAWDGETKFAPQAYAAAELELVLDGGERPSVGGFRLGDRFDYPDAHQGKTVPAYVAGFSAGGVVNVRGIGRPNVGGGYIFADKLRAELGRD